MANKWITAASGIRYRQHRTRKHGARLDRYYTLRLSIDGRQIEEALGWASDGWTVDLAQEELNSAPQGQAHRRGSGNPSRRSQGQSPSCAASS